MSFGLQSVCYICLSVPIIATAVQEELETGSASSGDASSAASTVTPTYRSVKSPEWDYIHSSKIWVKNWY